MCYHSGSAGFSLIELVVVLVLIAIVVSMSFFLMGEESRRSREGLVGVFSILNSMRPLECIQHESQVDPQTGAITERLVLYSDNTFSRVVDRVTLKNVRVSGTRKGCLLAGGMGYYDVSTNKPGATCFIGETKASGPSVCINAMGIVYTARNMEDPLK